MQTLAQLLRQALARLPAVSAAAAVATEIAQVNLTDVSDELKTLLDADDTAAVELAETLAHALARTPQASKARELVERVRMYDFSAARAVLEQIAIDS